jgi:hypothetical protein
MDLFVLQQSCHLADPPTTANLVAEIPSTFSFLIQRTEDWMTYSTPAQKPNRDGVAREAAERDFSLFQSV